MNRQKVLRFEAKDEDFLMLGSQSTNIRLTHHIVPQEFIKIYETISKNRNFEITQEFMRRFYKISTFFGIKRKSEVAFMAKCWLRPITGGNSI